MTTVSSIVMRRVRTIHLLRSLKGHMLAIGLVAAVSLVGIAHDVWVAQVFENMPPLLHVRTFFAFFLGAYLHTEFMVQLYVTLLALAFIALSLEVVRVAFVLVPKRELLIS